MHVWLPVLLLLALAVAAAWLWWRTRGDSRADDDGRERWPLFEAPWEPHEVSPEDAAAAPVRKKKRRRSRALPVVLAHGMFGFDEMKVRGKRVEYFRGVPASLKKDGATVHVVKLPPTASIEARAARLAEQVDRIDAPKVHLVTHSMGGVDARYAISKLALAGKVASLTTVGAPHHGTPLADAGHAVLGPKIGRALRMDGVADLTTARMTRFNREVPDAPGVHYASVVGAVSGIIPARIHPLLLPGFMWLRERAGVNDGVVPSDSQAWGDVLLEVDADHWAQIGWSKKFDASELFVRIVRELRGRA